MYYHTSVTGNQVDWIREHRNLSTSCGNLKLHDVLVQKPLAKRNQTKILKSKLLESLGEKLSIPKQSRDVL
jgi:hypothetical protein